ncbi:MAG: universal stress protein [Halodesulfurarchaeum sp.]|nr:universal stress protein [Halodesulfurarchaeum sp.]
MSGSASEGDVLVAVEDPEQVAQLVRTAADLARQGSGRVRLMTVVVKPADSPFGLFSDETIVREFAADSHELLDRAPDPEDVELVRDLVVARSVAKGIQSAVDRTDPAALLIGWDSDPRRSDALLGTTVDKVLERAATDVYVERIGREAGTVEEVLVPVAGGPNVRASVIAAGAIAVANDASVTIIAVAEDETGREGAQSNAEAGLETLKRAIDGPVTAETRVVSGERVEDAIIEVADGYDVIVLGATRKGVLRGRLVGSVPRRVVRGTDRTVIVARGERGKPGFLGRISRAISGKQ